MSVAFALRRRVGMLFAFQFLAMGVFLPYFPIFLADRGLDDARIGFILAVPLAIRIVTGPLIAALSDHLGRRARAIALIAGVAGLSAAAFAVADGFWPLLVVSVPLVVLHGALIPLSDAYAMDTVRAGRGDYGRMRLWGSLAFMAATLAAGAALERMSSELVPQVMAAALVATALLALSLPEMAHTVAAPTGQAPRLRAPAFLIVLAAAALAQGGHAAYYSFGSLHWRRLGIGETAIGACWVIGVLVEVALFMLATRIGTRLAPRALLALGAAAGVVRWTAFPLVDGLAGILALQMLHGLTFGATHLGLVGFIAQSIPAHRAATAQGLGATFIGIAMAAGTLASGPLYATDPAWAFWAMAGGSVVALVLLAAGRCWPTKPGLGLPPGP